MSYAVENHATGGSHIRLAPGTLINNTYEVVGEAGSGNFARVFECRDVRNGSRMAVKLMKPGYERDADFEQEVLNAVNKNDPSDTCGIVRLQEKLRWNGYTGLAFTLKGKCLRSSRTPMSRSDIVQVGKDVAKSLQFLHTKCRAVHTDLKPENILAEIDSSKPQKWVLCDFGSASFYTAAMDNDLITTRPYRAPEVVMKRGWNYNADTWSLGCILYELCVGRKLFDAQSDAEHLEVMQARLGPMPASMNPPRTLSSGRRGVRTLKEELSHEPQLLAVVEKLLMFDPAARPRCGDILAMPFFGGSAPSTPTNSAPAAYPLSSAAPTTTHSAAGTYKLSTATPSYGGAENRRIYATNTGVQRKDIPNAVPTTSSSMHSGLGSRTPQLASMSHAATNVPVAKSTYSASAFRVQNSNYSSATTRGAPPHPNQLPRPTELGTAGAIPRTGIMSPAMPNYVR